MLRKLISQLSRHQFKTNIVNFKRCNGKLSIIFNADWHQRCRSWSHWRFSLWWRWRRSSQTRGEAIDILGKGFCSSSVWVQIAADFKHVEEDALREQPPEPHQVWHHQDRAGLWSSSQTQGWLCYCTIIPNWWYEIMLSLFFAGTKQREPLDNFDIRTTSEARKGATSVVAGQRRTCSSAQAEIGL